MHGTNFNTDSILFSSRNYDKLKDLPGGRTLSHKTIELVNKKMVKPIGFHKIVNYEFTSVFVSDSTNKKESSKDSWARVYEAKLDERHTKYNNDLTVK